MVFSLDKVDQIEAHLATQPYLSEGGLPGAADAKIYMALNKEVPDVAKHPNFHHWYYFINSFSNDLMAMWIEKDKGKEEKKKVEDDDDLFGDDEPAEKPKPKAPVVVKKKPKAAPKSVVVFDIKVYDTETDLDELGKKVLAIKIDGLVWNNEPKKINVAYDIFKLQFGCVIEDEKVLTDDIFDPIEEWEEVQSVDMVSMQKI